MYPFTLHTLQARYNAGPCNLYMLNHFLESSTYFVECVREPGYDMRLTNDLPSKCPKPGSLPRERGEGRRTYDLSFGGKNLPWDMTPDETHYETEQPENETNYER